jgi:endonuclease/exonuclease/phosphatase family metal-dependent hydrolase
MAISILSYNIHWGMSSFRRINVGESLSRFIHSTQADIILLQELWLPKGELEYLIAETLREVWPHQVCVATCLLPLGNQGNGILSRHKIIEWQHIDFTYSGRQQRSFIHARLWLEEEGKILSLVCTHLGLRRSERLHQTKVLMNYVDAHVPESEALVIGGDFNDWRGELTQSFAARLGLQEVFKASYGHHARSYPAIKPLLALDRLYVRGMEFREPKVLKEAGWRGSSDHLPLAVDLSFSSF